MDQETLNWIFIAGKAIDYWLNERNREEKAEQEAKKKAIEESLRKAAEQDAIFKKNIFYGIIFVTFIVFITFLVKKMIDKSNEKPLPNKEEEENKKLQK